MRKEEGSKHQDKQREVAEHRKKGERDPILDQYTIIQKTTRLESNSAKLAVKQPNTQILLK